NEPESQSISSLSSGIGVRPFDATPTAPRVAVVNCLLRRRIDLVPATRADDYGPGALGGGRWVVGCPLLAVPLRAQRDSKIADGEPLLARAFEPVPLLRRLQRGGEGGVA